MSYLPKQHRLIQKTGPRARTGPEKMTGTAVKTSKTEDFAKAEGVRRDQYGALCWRLHRGRVEVLLVTSRDTGRWVIPKGWPGKGLKPAASAAREAWEEAGVEGQMAEAPLGLYTYAKRRLPDPPLACAVTVFGLRVQRLAESFPERAERRRKWFRAEKAARKVAEPELRELLCRVDADPALVTGVAAQDTRPDTAPGA
jgi:8-oxo-dGTP pyrophosphatase MutT (NUDIX family)